MLGDDLMLLASSVTHIIVGMLSYIKQASFSPAFCKPDLSVSAFNAANSGLRLACNHLTSTSSNLDYNESNRY